VAQADEQLLCLSACEWFPAFAVQNPNTACTRKSICYHFDMPSLLIRGIPEDVGKALAADAERHRRSREKHALFLIEQGLAQRPLETAGELLDAIWAAPPPNVVSDKEIDKILASRGRRSNRPA
jgi:hypothetical protein